MQLNHVLFGYHMAKSLGMYVQLYTIYVCRCVLLLYLTQYNLRLKSSNYNRTLQNSQYSKIYMKKKNYFRIQSSV